MNLCVFCSANDNIAPLYFEKAEELGQWAAKNAHSIVFGGHDAGLMHAVSKAAKEAGGRVIGVVPRVIERMGKLSPWMDVHIPTEDLTDRKQLMMDQSDAVAAAATLGYHHKPVIVYNIDGFWQSLLDLLGDLEARGMMRRAWREQILVANTLDEISSFLHN